MTLLRKYEKLRMLVWVKTIADTIMATFIGPECSISPTSSSALDLTACKDNIGCVVGIVWKIAPCVNQCIITDIMTSIKIFSKYDCHHNKENSFACSIISLSWNSSTEREKLSCDLSSLRKSHNNNCIELKKTSYSTKSSIYFSAVLYAWGNN